MQMAPETLVKTKEPVDSDRRQQKRNREAGRINSEKKNAAGNRFRIGGERQDGRENRADAWRPSEGECEAQQEAAGYARKSPAGFCAFFSLRSEIMEADIAIEPASQRWPGKKNKCDREQLHRAKHSPGTHGFSPRTPPEDRGAKRQHAADHESRSNRQFDQPPDQV